MYLGKNGMKMVLRDPLTSKTEIKTISEKTNFNGQTLLDGSFQNTSFQTGANVGEQVDVSIARTADDTLGTSIANGISSSTTSSTAALAAGDLTLNGVAVGASSAFGFVFFAGGGWVVLAKAG